MSESKMSSFEKLYTKNPKRFPDLRKYNDKKKLERRKTWLLNCIQQQRRKNKTNTEYTLTLKREYNYIITKCLIYDINWTNPSFIINQLSLQLLDYNSAKELKILNEDEQEENRKKAASILFNSIEDLIKLEPTFKKNLFKLK